MKVPKVIHLSTNDFGGAGSAAIRFHRAFLALGYNSELFLAETNRSVLGDGTRIVPTTNIKLKLRTFFRRYLPSKIFTKLKHILTDKYRFSSGKRYLFFTQGESLDSGINPSLVEAIQSADYLLVHWVAGFVNTRDILEIHRNTRCKVFFITMDMAHLTGGCHYYWDCRGFVSDCSDCPALDYNTRQYANHQLRIKSINVAMMNASILCCSSRIMEDAKASAIPYKEYINLPIPINHKVFTPKKSVDSDGLFRVLTNANDVNNPRKGFSYLLQVLVQLDQMLSGEAIICIMCLDSSPFLQMRFRHIEFQEFSYCENDEALASLYRSVNLFVNTSIEDAGPMMLVEALMCGVPVISFDVGMANELIRDGHNGHVVSMFDSKSIAEKIFKYSIAGVSHFDDPNQIHQELAEIFSIDSWEVKVKKILTD